MRIYDRSLAGSLKKENKKDIRIRLTKVTGIAIIKKQKKPAIVLWQSFLERIRGELCTLNLSRF